MARQPAPDQFEPIFDSRGGSLPVAQAQERQVDLYIYEHTERGRNRSGTRRSDQTPPPCIDYASTTHVIRHEPKRRETPRSPLARPNQAKRRNSGFVLILEKGWRTRGSCPAAAAAAAAAVASGRRTSQERKGKGKVPMSNRPRPPGNHPRCRKPKQEGGEKARRRRETSDGKRKVQIRTEPKIK
jgi:hypothetical protein